MNSVFLFDGDIIRGVVDLVDQLIKVPLRWWPWHFFFVVNCCQGGHGETVTFFLSFTANKEKKIMENEPVQHHPLSRDSGAAE